MYYELKGMDKIVAEDSCAVNLGGGDYLMLPKTPALFKDYFSTTEKFIQSLKKAHVPSKLGPENRCSIEQYCINMNIMDHYYKIRDAFLSRR